MAERLRAVVTAARPGGLSRTASFGVAVAEGTDIAFESLFHRADKALYAAKSAGRNRVSVARPGAPATSRRG